MFFTGANAAVVITAVENGGDVIFSSAGGSLDLTGLVLDQEGTITKSIDPSIGVINMGGGVFAPFDSYYSGISGPDGFGSGGFAPAADGSGDRYGVNFTGSRVIIVPDGYVSNAALSASSLLFSGENFASLGITPGSYEWSWANDSITLNAVAPVPIPAAVWLFGSALGLLGWMRRKAAEASSIN